MARNTFKIDEELEAPFQWIHLKRAMRYILKYKRNMIIVFCATVTAILLGLIPPLMTQRVVDEFIPEKATDKLLITGGILLAIMAVSVTLGRVRARLNAITGQNIILDIRRDLFTHLQKLPFEYYDSRPAGKIFVRVVNYVNSIADFLSSGLINIILEPLSMVIIVFFMMSISVKMTLVILAGLPVFLVYIFTVRPRQRKAWQAYNNKSSNMTAYLAENINGVRITQAFTREDFNMEVFDGLQAETRRYWMRVIYFIHSNWPSSTIISKLVVISLYLSGVYLFRDEMTIGSVLAMAGLAWRFWAPVQSLGQIFNGLMSTASYLERIFQVLDEPVNVTDKPDAYELPQINGIITFLNVDFSYEKGVPILNDVSFEVAPGESIALVGPTGAGKTTIINLLSRFYNVDSGGIYIDGHEIHDVTIESLRRQMGVMLQDTFIFAGNIIENIRYGRLDATDEECIEAAKRVCADEFITKLPDGYYHTVHERGEGLSAGQRQLISFARTLLASPRILILDEATSSIDTQTERLVQQGLNELLRGRTSFIVAHRLSTIQSCTRILYICDGVIAESGSHEELLKKRGLYWHLYTSQL